MRTPSNFAEQVDKLNKIIERVDAPIMERIRALCDLYFWYRGDVHYQSMTVRRIENLIRDL